MNVIGVASNGISASGHGYGLVLFVKQADPATTAKALGVRTFDRAPLGPWPRPRELDGEVERSTAAAPRPRGYVTLVVIKTQLNSVVTQRIEVAPGLAMFRIAPEGWTLPRFTAGQFAVIGLPATAARIALSDAEEPAGDSGRLIRRAYSIASSPLARDHIEIFVNIVRSGELTPRLFALGPGDRIWLGRKFAGMFTLREVPRERHVAMIATGTGLAPYMSMMRTELECGGPRRFAVLHGGRHSWDLGYAAELVTMQRLCRNFTYVPTVSRPEAELVPWGGSKGHVQALWTGRALERAWSFRPTPKNTHVFLCGNPAMIEDMIKLLGAEGFKVHERHAPGQIHVERYW